MANLQVLLTKIAMKAMLQEDNDLCLDACSARAAR
jgi:hypothetical protein